MKKPADPGGLRHRCMLPGILILLLGMLALLQGQSASAADPYIPTEKEIE